MLARLHEDSQEEHRDLTVFDVGGNKYRVAGFVHYRKQIVYIKRIGTHEEYDKWDL